MRPGLTGLWQLRDRVNSSSAVPMITHDLEYVQTFSIWQDFKILVLTIPAVLSCRGAV
jgi:lipopolysaccharide/colanic/teichoic acid biosynthesis glycosyltransferase